MKECLTLTKRCCIIDFALGALRTMRRSSLRTANPSERSAAAKYISWMQRAARSKSKCFVREGKYADVAKLADAQVSGSCGRPWGFKSLRPHQTEKRSFLLRFLFGKKKGTRRDLKGEARTRESGLRQGEKETEGGRANCTALRAVQRGAPNGIDRICFTPMKFLHAKRA